MQVSSTFTAGASKKPQAQCGGSLNPAPAPPHFWPDARPASPVSHTAPSTRTLARPAAPSARGALSGAGVRAAPGPRPPAPLSTPRAGQQWAGGDVAARREHMSRSRAAAGSPRLPRAGSRRRRQHPGPGSRAACARRRAGAAAAGGPLPAGGRRAEGSGEREEGEGRQEPPGRRERAPRRASCAGGGKASERILVARFSGWWCLGTGTPSAAAGFAEALARQVSTHTPSWFAANKARHRKRRSKCYSPCTGPRASRAEQPPFPRQNDPFTPQTSRTCLGCPERSLGRRNPGELILAAPPPTSGAAAAAAAAERKEPTRLSHREFAIWPLDPLTGAPWVLVPRSFLQPNPIEVLPRLLLI